MNYTDWKDPRKLYNSVVRLLSSWIKLRLRNASVLLRSSNSPSHSIEQFVGDLVQLFPVEIVDTIFAYCEPEEIFKWRNVSHAWNSYLSRPQFLQYMSLKMHVQDGQCLLNSGRIQSRSRMFEDRVRHRCALINGRAFLFEHVQHPAEILLDRIWFRSGVLIGKPDTYRSSARHIYVKRLYRDDPEWDILELAAADFDTEWTQVELTSKHILALTNEYQVYCWSAASLDLLAKFWVTTVPDWIDESDYFDEFGHKNDRPSHTINGPGELIGASSSTIVIVCELVWYLYSLDTGKLTAVDMQGRAPDSCCQYRVEQSGYLYAYSGDNFREYCVDIFKINDTGTSIDFVSRIDLYTLGRQQLATMASDFGAEVVESSVDTFEALVIWEHECFCTSSYEKAGVGLYLVFELKDGIMTYHHAIPREDCRPIPEIFYPQLHQSFDCNHCPSKVLHQIREKTYRPMIACQSKLRSRDDHDASLHVATDEEEADGLRQAEVLRSDFTPNITCAGGTNCLICSQSEAPFTTDEEEADELKWAELPEPDFNDPYISCAGDNDFLICSNPEVPFIEVWRLYEPDEGRRPRAAK